MSSEIMHTAQAAQRHGAPRGLRFFCCVFYGLRASTNQVTAPSGSSSDRRWAAETSVKPVSRRAAHTSDGSYTVSRIVSENSTSPPSETVTVRVTEPSSPGTMEKTPRRLTSLNS